MVNVNKNSALEVLQGLVEQSFSKNYASMPEGFNEKQQMAFDLFKQRIFLEEVLEASVAFNRGLVWESDNSHVKLVSTVEELIEIYKLRSDVYTEIGFQSEFPDIIDGLNFDKYDKNSAIIYYQKEKEISGTCRLIFDSENKLLTESKLCFQKFREEYGLICELSRLVIPNKNKTLGLEYKQLTAGIYKLYKLNGIGLIMSGTRKEHYEWYKKFGGFKIEKEMVEGYGSLKEPFVVTSWNPAEVSSFFKRAFLNIKQ